MYFPVSSLLIEYLILTIVQTQDSILKKLEKSGYLTTYSQLHQGRKRKYYSITALGKQQIQQLHEEWVSYRDTIEGIIEGRLRK